MVQNQAKKRGRLPPWWCCLRVRLLDQAQPAEDDEGHEQADDAQAEQLAEVQAFAGWLAGFLAFGWRFHAKLWLRRLMNYGSIAAMNKTDALKLLGDGTVAAAAKRLGVSYQAVAKWPAELTQRIKARVVDAVAEEHLDLDRLIAEKELSTAQPQQAPAAITDVADGEGGDA